MLEMDTHADTCVFGKNFVVLHYTGRECDVLPYSSSAYDAVTGVSTVSGATAWTHQNTGETFILVIHEGLWMPDSVDHSLINPNELRAFGSVIQDNSFDLTGMALKDPEACVSIPMSLSSAVIGFETRTPTQDELDHCQHLVLSSQHH
jgi:hypothetical protein